MQQEPHGVSENQPERLTLSRKEAAVLLGISEKLLWTKTKASRIPHIRIGGRVLYPRENLERWLEDQASRSVK